MPNVVKLLRSTASGAAPAALVSGQIAINEADGKIFWLDANGVTIRSVTLKDLDTIVAAKLAAASNLSDLSNAATARNNLGLSSLATTTPGTGVATALGANIGAAGALITANNTNNFTKGFTVTPNNIGTPAASSTVTPDPALGNYQYLTNNAAFTLAAPSSDCAIDILVTNGSTAGAITLSGFTAPSGGGGDTYATTNANRYLLMIRRINSVATYAWKALQ